MLLAEAAAGSLVDAMTGLAAAAMLQRALERVVAHERGEVGAAWCARHDCLRLHTAPRRAPSILRAAKRAP